MLRDLDGRVAIVTGSSSGIGAAVARRFAAEGARVAGFDLRPSEGCELGVIADLRDSAALGRGVASTRDNLGSPTILVHAAAASASGGSLTTAPEVWADIYDVNVIGAVRLLRLFADGLGAAGGGSAVMISSINANFATPTLAAYSASKAALESLVKTAAVELASNGIRINAIAPASIDTPLLRASFANEPDMAAARQTNERRHPIARWGTADEVAELALFLASERSAWITGATYAIDGGASATRQ